MQAPTRSLVTALAITLTLLAALGSAHLTPAVSATERTFAVHLSSAGTGCPSHGQGQVLFRVDDEGRFTWRLILTNLDNVTAAYLTTPLSTVRLFGGRGTPPEGVDPGSGLFTEGDLAVVGDPGYIPALVAALADGTATVSVYTADCPGPALQGTPAGA